MHGLELDDVETVGKDAIGFALEKMLRFVCSDVRDSGEDIGTVGGGSFDTVAVVDAALASFVVDVEILEVVVEIDAACAEVASQEGCVGGEDGAHVDVAFAAEGDCESGLPFVEMRDDGGG